MVKSKVRKKRPARKKRPVKKKKAVKKKVHANRAKKKYRKAPKKAAKGEDNTVVPGNPKVPTPKYGQETPFVRPDKKSSAELKALVIPALTAISDSGDRPIRNDCTNINSYVNELGKLFGIKVKGYGGYVPNGTIPTTVHGKEQRIRDLLTRFATGVNDREVSAGYIPDEGSDKSDESAGHWASIRRTAEFCQALEGFGIGPYVDDDDTNREYRITINLDPGSATTVMKDPKDSEDWLITITDRAGNLIVDRETPHDIDWD